MKTTYKNKRDYYKSEAEREKERAKILEERLRLKEEECNKQKEKDKKEKEENNWYDIKTYCSNCETVNDYRVRKGLTIQQGGCIHCKVKGSNIHNVKR